MVALKRFIWATAGGLFRATDKRLIEQFQIFAPNSAGPLRQRAEITVRGANQIFPLLVELLRVVGRASVRGPLPILSVSDSDKRRANAERLRALFDKHGSDKAAVHAYHHVYGAILEDPDEISTLLEVGIGTNKRDVVSHMGSDGRPGASLRAFSEYLPNAVIYGADVDRRILFAEGRIRTFFVDQTDPGSFGEIAAAIPQDFDVIIDDGLHAPNANVSTLTFALQRLKVRGWFVVEDISAAAVPLWSVVSALLPANYESRLIDANGVFLFLVQRKV